MTQESELSPPPGARVVIAIGVPIVGAILLSSVVDIFVGGQIDAPPQADAALFLGLLGALSLMVGLRWYGRAGMGLRGGRPLYASIGFAVLGWLAFLLLRLILVESNPDQLVSQNSGRLFLYLLLFEAFCVQLWAFGLVFHAVSDWRGPLSAAVTGGVVFGALSAQFFQEAFISGLTATLFFIFWGAFYGFIRLRSGSLIGMALVQALQSFTTWHIWLPQEPPVIGQLQNFYVATFTIILVLIWRLWPKEESDYRV